MKGLFYKDLLNLKTHFFYYALEIAVFAAVSYFMENVYFFCGLMIFLSVSATISNMQCDEVDGFEKFAVLSGISKKKLVGEKYLFSAFALLVSAVLGAAMNLVMRSDKAGFFADAIYTFSALLVIDVLYPLFFRYGVEKSRSLYVLIFAGTLLLAAASGFFIGGAEIDLALLAAIFGVFGALFTAVSFAISVKILKSK